MMTLNMLIVAIALLGISVSKTTTDEEQVRKAVKQFSKSADAQDVAGIQSVLHPEAQQFFMGPEGMVRLETTTYVSMIEQKKIGGQPRQLSISHVDVDGDMASVKANMSNDAYQFDNFISLMKVDGSWQIVSIVLRMKAK